MIDKWGTLFLRELKTEVANVYCPSKLGWGNAQGQYTDKEWRKKDALDLIFLSLNLPQNNQYL